MAEQHKSLHTSYPWLIDLDGSGSRDLLRRHDFQGYLLMSLKFTVARYLPSVSFQSTGS